jgi:hypothetical protein
MKKNEKGVYFNESELRTMLDINTSFEEKIYLPNKIFEELTNCDLFKKNNRTIYQTGASINKGKANVNHIAFAFSYLYVISYMYRYAKFIYKDKFGSHVFIDDKILFKICNTSPFSTGKDGVNYVVKKGGVLEQLGYIRKEKDYPVTVRFNKDWDYTGESSHFELDFSMNSQIEYTSDYNNFSRKSVNYPIRAFCNDDKDDDENDLNGYFFVVDNTVEIDINVFIFCMSRKEISTLGFYLYSYIKSKSNYYGGSYNRALSSLINDTGIQRTKLTELLKTLERYNMITNNHRPFVVDLPPSKKIPANSYKTLEYKDFMKSGNKKVGRSKVMSLLTYDHLHGEYLEPMVEV